MLFVTTLFIVRYTYVDFNLKGRGLAVYLKNIMYLSSSIFKGMLYFVILYYKLPTIPLEIFA